MVGLGTPGLGPGLLLWRHWNREPWEPREDCWPDPVCLTSEEIDPGFVLPKPSKRPEHLAGKPGGRSGSPAVG